MRTRVAERLESQDGKVPPWSRRLSLTEVLAAIRIGESIGLGFLHHHAHSEANVAESFDGGKKSPLRALPFMQQCDIPELAARRPGCLGGGHALAKIALRKQLKVKLNLCFEFSVEPFPREEPYCLRYPQA